MCLDLNRCLYYSDAKGLHLDAPNPVRTVLTIMDGIVAGEGEGPLAPRNRPLGCVLAATDPVALDLVAVQLMGFDHTRIPKICEAMRDAGPRVTAVRIPAEVRAVQVTNHDPTGREMGLEEIRCEVPFLPHVGWVGRIERNAS
jgi:uncharacterized protein (DUF362 family)